MVSNWTIWPSELNQKGFILFSAYHTMPGETKGSLFSVFSALWNSFSKKILQSVPLQFSKFFNTLQQRWSLKSPPPLCAKVRSNFWVFRVLWKRILDTLKSFCYFWASDMAPTFPACFLPLVKREIDEFSLFSALWDFFSIFFQVR